MLVLARKRDEEIRIGDDIVIRVIKLGNNCVRIGIDAPASVRVRRGELVIHDLQLSLDDNDSQTLEECTLEAVMVQN